MMKWFLGRLLWFFVIPAVTTAVCRAQPKIVLSDTLVDVGSVYSGSVVTRTVKVSNNGDRTLHILHIDAQCNCTRATISSDTIKPHRSATLRLDINTSSSAGEIHKGLVIVSDDPRTRNAFVLINANIKEAVQPAVRELVFVQMDSFSSALRKFAVKNMWDRPWRILSVQDSSDLLDASWQRKNLSPGDSTFITVRVRKYVQKSTEGILKVRTSCSVQQYLKINYYIVGSQE